ncbi:MAG: cupin-like domain-containing protein [Polyangiales bacterium]
MHTSTDVTPFEPVRLTFEKVEERHGLSARELEGYLRAQTPVIIRGALEHCPAMKRWATPDMLADRVGDVEVLLTRSTTWPIRYFRDLPEVPTPFREGIRRVFTPDENASYYMHQRDLLSQAPQLAEDLIFPFPELATEFQLQFQEALFWIGSADTVSRLHCDFPHNIVGQIKGAKQFRIFPHEQAPRFYPPAPFSPDPYHTPVSTMGDCSARDYPLMTGARGLDASISEGDVLVLPSLWWHQVVAREASVMVNWFSVSPTMARDWPAMLPWAAALAGGEWEQAIKLATQYETAHVRDAGLAATARHLLTQDEPALALRALGLVANPGYAREMAALLPA